MHCGGRVGMGYIVTMQLSERRLTAEQLVLLRTSGTSERCVADVHYDIYAQCNIGKHGEDIRMTVRVVERALTCARQVDCGSHTSRTSLERRLASKSSEKSRERLLA